MARSNGPIEDDMRGKLTTFVCWVAGLTALAGGAVLSADEEKEAMDLSVYAPADVKWQDGPTSIPRGAKLAILEGNPAKEGWFVMRLKLPDGYRVPPHIHPKPERVTVIAGTFNIGMGDKFD